MKLLALRLLIRDWRAGELRVLVVALLIAVTCVTAVAFFTDRIGEALERQASEVLGADLRLVADHPIPAAWRSEVQRLGLHSAEIRTFRSMVIADGRPRLAEIKAAGPGYPLRGRLRIAPAPFAAATVTDALPARGEVWVQPLLLQQLGIRVGDAVSVGDASLRIGAVLSYEPDRSGNLFSIAPRLLMNLADLPATGLEQEGSRMHYALLVAGDAAAVARYRRFITPRLKQGERVEGVADARQEVRVALARAHQFLGLAAVVGVVLACVAVAMAARRFARRHLDTCAVMRCLGARQGQLNALFLSQLLVLGVSCGLLGSALGYGAQAVLSDLLGQLLLVALPPAGLLPVLVGLAVALGGSLGFALPPILQLHNVPTLRVLRRELGGLRPAGASSYLAGMLGLTALVWWQAGEVKLALIMLVGLLATALLLWLAAWGLVALLRRLPPRGDVAWRFGLANLTRRPAASVAQVMAFGVGIMVLLLLTVVRGDLLAVWAGKLPADAPNRFVINIQPDQLADVKAFFTAEKLPPARFFPMVRGRLVAIDGKPIRPEAYHDTRAKRLAEREFNLSWNAKLQGDNKIVKGQWWGLAGRGVAQFSVEEGIAKTLGIKLGDTLSYDMAGDRLTAPVTSLRSVQWDSFRANFFVLAPPGVLDRFPASYITSFYLPAAQAGRLDALVQRFPNLTVIDVSAVMDQVRGIIERVSLAVEYVFLFTLAAGLTVLYAAIQSTLDERLYENAVLRALGAQRRRLWWGLAAEFSTLGALAGILAALLASGLGFALAQWVLELDYLGNPWLWIFGLLGGGLGVGLAGTLGARQVVRSPPLVVLRGG
jgi:putative ABC transport system permease protein